MDFSSLLAAALFFCSNILNSVLIILTARSARITNESPDQIFNSMKQLDSTYIEKEWDTRHSYRNLETAAGLMHAIAWFLFCIPLIQTAWILSRGGKRHLGTHLLIAGLAFAGSIVELLSLLMTVGVNNVLDWMAQDFNLDDWASYGDGMGWKVLEMLHIASFGILAWVDAFEWLALSAVLMLICGSVHAELKDEGVATFGKKWSSLGLVIGVLCWIDFIADTLRIRNFVVFSAIAGSISALNTVILLPIWILILGYQLPSLKPKFEELPAPKQDEVAEVPPVETAVPSGGVVS